MLSITTAIFIALFASFVYNIIPTDYWRARLWAVVLFSFTIVLAYYPIAAIIASICAVYSWAVISLASKYRLIRKYGPLVVLFILAGFSLEDIQIPVDSYSKTLLQFGMSFYILRLYLLMRTAISKGSSVTLVESLTTSLFFPIFPAGPICAQEAFTQSPNMERSIWTNYAEGFLRLGMGILSLYVFTEWINEVMLFLAPDQKNDSRIAGWDSISPLIAYLVMMLGFLKLYANFSGYTQIAIGLGLFFGFAIPENFRYPFLATNIQNFWQRWHLSLSKFITDHIYLPLMLTIRKPRIAIFLAFVLVGLWHKVEIQYLVWGIGHGLALALYMTLSKHQAYQNITAKVPRPVHLCYSWLLTLSWVAFLSTFANEPTKKEALEFVSSLTSIDWVHYAKAL